MSLMATMGSVDVMNSWDYRSHQEAYDVAVCVGPVSSCPLSKRRVLFVFGPTCIHPDYNWDLVVVTSDKARIKAVRRFGHKVMVFLAPPPLLALEAGRRRLMDPQDGWIHASPLNDVSGPNKMTRMALWSNPKDGQHPFNPMEFNSRALNGAKGFYMGMDDGYDIQVRRHLHLGSPVVCPRDREVIGGLADVCFETIESVASIREPILDGITTAGYKSTIQDIMRRV
jgi:hypothetical protein